jgi:hypothetical protein
MPGYMKIEFFLSDFGKEISNIKFHENQSSGRRVVLCQLKGEGGQMERDDEADNRFSRFCESV